MSAYVTLLMVEYLLLPFHFGPNLPTCHWLIRHMLACALLTGQLCRPSCIDCIHERSCRTCARRVQIWLKFCCKRRSLHSISSFGLLLRSLSLLKERLRLLVRLLLLPPRPPRPPLPPFGFSFGGGRTNAKSTEIVWSRSLVLFRALTAAFASGWVGYSIKAYPCKMLPISSGAWTREDQGRP